MEKDQREDKNHNNETSSQSEASQMKPQSREISTGEWSCLINSPLDLKVEIFKKLPVKSLLRFRCLSKEWSTIISTGKDFIDSIVTRSLAHPQPDCNFILNNYSFSPRLDFLFTSTYPNQTHVVPFINKTITKYTEFQYVRGLIGYWSLYGGNFTIHNPTTRQSLSLPHCNLLHGRFYLFGYDPNEKQYKVVCVPKNSKEKSCYVFTLGDLTKEWRNIDYNIVGHVPVTYAVMCINGTIYYNARNLNERRDRLLSFDVRSEEFNYVQTPQELREWTLLNYKGKLGCNREENFNAYVDMWVRKDEEKQEWSKIPLVSRYRLEQLLGIQSGDIRCLGVTPSGEVVIVSGPDLQAKDPNTPLDVYYYDLEKDTSRRTEIDITSLAGNISRLRIWAVPVHVENTMSL